MKLLGLAGLFLLTAAAGFGLGMLASGWVEADWPTIDESDENGWAAA